MSSAYHHQLYSSYAPPPPHPQFRQGSERRWQSPPSATLFYPQGRRLVAVCSPPPQAEQHSIQSTSSRSNKKKRVTFKSTCTIRTHVGCYPMTNDERSNTYYSRQELKLLNLEAYAITTLSQDLPEIANAGTHLREKDRRNSGNTIFTATATILNTKRRDSWLGLNDEGTKTTTTSTSIASNTTNNNSKKGTMLVDTLRGLELIMYPKRKQNKILAQRSLLKYQQLLKSKPHLSTEREEALAIASTKLNLWSTMVAIETARLDALRAYDGCDYLIPIEPLTLAKDDESMMMKMKQPFSYNNKRVEEGCEVRRKQHHHHQKQHQQLKRKYERNNSFRRVTYDNKDSRNDDEAMNSSRRRSTPAQEFPMATTIINYDAMFQHESSIKRRRRW